MQLQYIHQNNKKMLMFSIVLGLIYAVVTVETFSSMFSMSLFSNSFTLNIGGSFVYLWNSIADTLGHREFILLTQYATSVQSAGTILALLSIIFTGINTAVIYYRKRVFLTLYVLPFFIFQLIWDIPLSMLYGTAFILCTIFVYIYITSLNDFDLKNFVLIPLIMIVVVVTVSIFLNDNYVKPKAIESTGQGIESLIYTTRYGPELLKGNDFRSVGKREIPSEGTALEISMDYPESMYLRGFVGSKYSNSGWITLDNATYYDNNELFKQLHDNGFSGLSQLESVTKLVNQKDKQNDINVTNKGANREYFYLPYELMETEIRNCTNYADSFMKGSGFRGADVYSFKSSQNRVKEWPDMAGKIFSVSNSEALDEYKLLESHYNVFQYDNYVELPENVLELLEKEMGPVGSFVKGHVEYKEAIKKVQNHLEDNTVYTERITPLKKGDFLQNFFHKNKGYDVHYASAATAMFRYYGIPSRYVEGYLITPEDIKTNKSSSDEQNQSDSVLEIPQSNVHAWTEIYVDTLGWIPIEVTPEYYDKMDQPDMSKGLETISSNDPLSKKQDDSEMKDEVDEGSDDEGITFPWQLIFLILLGLLVLAALIYLILKLSKSLRILYARRRAYRHKNPRRAVCAIYESILALEMEADKSVHAIGERAAYSRHPITEKDRRYMLQTLKDLKERKRRNGSKKIKV